MNNVVMYFPRKFTRSKHLRLYSLESIPGDRYTLLLRCCTPERYLGTVDHEVYIDILKRKPIGIIPHPHAHRTFVRLLPKMLELYRKRERLNAALRSLVCELGLKVPEQSIDEAVYQIMQVIENFRPKPVLRLVKDASGG